MDLYGLKFKCTNLTELRDESIYIKLKEDTQRDFLLFVFLYNIVIFHKIFMLMSFPIFDKDITFYERLGINESNKKNIEKEIKEFQDFIRLDKNKDKFEQLSKEGSGRNYNSSYFYNIFSLYDDTFNNKIILQKLSGFELDNNKYYSIILYFIENKNIDMLKGMFDPIINSRSTIIKNYNVYAAPYTGSSINILPLKISNETQYKLDAQFTGDFFYDFDDRFKHYIMKGEWYDGYDFYWNIKDENDYRKDKTNCLKYLVEILDPENQQIISMTITRSPNPALATKQIHYYIKRNLLSDIKLIITGKPLYRKVSLLIHSFATWLFNTDAVFSDLMSSMKKIFEANGINIDGIYNDPQEKLINELAYTCIRGAGERIIIDKKFRNMWTDGYSIIPEREDSIIRTYQLKQLESSKNKYLKYKAKYISLKNFIAKQKNYL